MDFDVHVGDMREVLAGFEPDSFDALATDPPYGLSFMGKGWDRGVPGVEFWKEALRVAKPGAHLLAFGGTRTYHRLMCAIEDAGWEIRDCIMWVYGQGFPKSLNLKGEWQGWGTALKPSWEPIIVARKPLEGTVAQNVLKHGTGGINIDGCRIGTTVETWPKSRSYAPGQMQPGHSGATQSTGAAPAGRWPANLIHDGSEEVMSLFPADAARFFYCAKTSKKDRGADNRHPTVKPTDLMRYCVKLVTPLGGTVLDPFMGSGSTGKAALLEGMNFVGVELDAEYAKIATARLNAAQTKRNGAC